MTASSREPFREYSAAPLASHRDCINPSPMLPRTPAGFSELVHEVNRTGRFVS